MARCIDAKCHLYLEGKRAAQITGRPFENVSYQWISGTSAWPAIFRSPLPLSVDNRMPLAHLAHNVALLFYEDDPALRASKCFDPYYQYYLSY